MKITPALRSYLASSATITAKADTLPDYQADQLAATVACALAEIRLDPEGARSIARVEALIAGRPAEGGVEA